MMDICFLGHLSYFEPTYDLSRLKPLVWLLALFRKYMRTVHGDFEMYNMKRYDVSLTNTFDDGVIENSPCLQIPQRKGD